MPGTPRKTAAQKAAPAAGASSETINLDSLLAPPPLDPVNVTLLGESYEVRRDFTAAEVVRFWSGMSSKDNAQVTAALVLLLGSAEAGDRLAAQLEPLPTATMKVVWQQMGRIAQLLPSDGSLGESPAS